MKMRKRHPPSENAVAVLRFQVPAFRAVPGTAESQVRCCGSRGTSFLPAWMHGRRATSDWCRAPDGLSARLWRVRKPWKNARLLPIRLYILAQGPHKIQALPTRRPGRKSGERYPVGWSSGPRREVGSGARQGRPRTWLVPRVDLFWKNAWIHPAWQPG